MVYAVDRGVKDMVNALKSTGQYENTLIIFLSDNGGRPDKGAKNYPLREGKGSTCEGGFRTPMFFHWPNVVPKGKKFNYTVTALDFYPTFARLAEAKIPKGKDLDGKNIWDNFLAGKDSHKDESIFVLRHRIKWSDVGIRKNQWKALKVYNQKWRLYNLEKDLSEKYDLSSTYPEILNDMIKDAALWSKTHKEPKWWHNEQTAIKWEEENMPHFEKTFKID
jgi:arylsulfatase A-like enzyme